jgi:hypothetical protein
MDTANVSAFARHLFETQGPKALAEAAQKALACEQSGDREQAQFWRSVEAVMLEIRGPRQT